MGLNDLLEGILIPIAISILASVVRVALWGWKGVRHFAANICVSCFAGVCAHWLLSCFHLSPTVNAVIISLAALLSRDCLAMVFSRKTLAVTAGAVRKRIVSEIVYRAAPSRHE